MAEPNQVNDVWAPWSHLLSIILLKLVVEAPCIVTGSALQSPFTCPHMKWCQELKPAHPTGGSSWIINPLHPLKDTQPRWKLQILRRMVHCPHCTCFPFDYHRVWEPCRRIGKRLLPHNWHLSHSHHVCVHVCCQVVGQYTAAASDAFCWDCTTAVGSRSKAQAATMSAMSVAEHAHWTHGSSSW